MHTKINQTYCGYFSLHWAGLLSIKLCLQYICFYFVGAKYEVEVESGLDENKGLEILALYTHTKPHRLPEEARSIVRECKGL